MISLREYLVEEGLKDLIGKIKKRIGGAKKDTLKAGDKNIEVEEIIKQTNDNISKRKNAHNEENLDAFIKDIITIVKKDPDKFKKIKNDLLEWASGNDKGGSHHYGWDEFIKNRECTEYIEGICNKLDYEYDWNGVAIEGEDEPFEDENGRWVEDDPMCFNTAFVAFTLASIAEEIK